MRKKGRYTKEEDLFIIAFYDGVGDFIGPHDLGRTKSSVTQRAEFLKESGAWESAKAAQRHESDFLIRAGHMSRAKYEEFSDS